MRENNGLVEKAFNEAIDLLEEEGVVLGLTKLSREIATLREENKELKAEIDRKNKEVGRLVDEVDNVAYELSVEKEDNRVHKRFVGKILDYVDDHYEKVEDVEGELE